MDATLHDLKSIAFRIHTDQDTLVSWTGDDGEGNHSAVASDSFKAVKTHFERSTSLSDREKRLITSSTCIEDVQQVVTGLVAKYESKSDSSKTRKWLLRTSETICHYGTVLDVFVQQNPEYVSLVWGTFKLLFSVSIPPTSTYFSSCCHLTRFQQSVVNHAETLKLLAKSTTEIANRLPRVKMLSQLYSTKKMREAVDNLYSCILEFLLIAHSWCNESKFRHLYRSFTQPHKLQYQRLLDRITDCSNNVMELATLGCQTEIRVMHTSQARKLVDILNALEVGNKEREHQLQGLARVVSRLQTSEERLEMKLDMVFSLLEASGQTVNELLAKTESRRYSLRYVDLSANTDAAHHYLQTSSRVDTNQSIQRLQLTDVLATFAISFEEPEKTYRHYLLLRNWRATRTGASVLTNQFWLSRTLAQWSSKDTLPLVIVRGPFNSRHAILDFGTSIIQTLSTSAIPTLWALKGLDKSKSQTLTPVELMKYLTCQVLKLSSDRSSVTPSEKQMAVCRYQFNDAKTLKEMLSIFMQATASLPARQIYLIIDLAAVHADLDPEISFIQKLHEILADGDGRPRIKVLLLLYEAYWYDRVPRHLNDKVVFARVMKPKSSRQRKEIQQAVNTHVFPCYRGMRGRGTGRGCVA